MRAEAPPVLFILQGPGRWDRKRLLILPGLIGEMAAPGEFRRLFLFVPFCNDGVSLFVFPSVMMEAPSAVIPRGRCVKRLLIFLGSLRE